MDLQTLALVTNPPTYAYGALPLVNSQWLDVDFHPWKANLELIIALLEQHYNNLKHSYQVCFKWGWSTTPPHPYKPLGLWAGLLPHCQITFCLSPKSWGQVDIFPSNLHNIVVRSLILSREHLIYIYSLHR